MKRISSVVALAVLGALMVGSGMLAAQQRTADVALRAAMEMETVTGDLRGAIAAYKKIAQGSDKSVGAKALWRMAECYQKLGDVQARKIYEQIVRDFNNQPEAAQARTRLAQTSAAGRGANTSGGMAQRQIWTGPWAVWGNPLSTSPDGRYGAGGDPSGYVLLHDLAARSHRLLSGSGPAPYPGYSDYSAFSRDGKQVAYVRENTDNNKRPELWVANVTGDANPRRVFANDGPAANYMRPTDWSPDGKKLALIIYRKQRPDSIGIFSLADQSLHELTTIGSDKSKVVSFSPDGRYVGFSREVGDDNAKQLDVTIHGVDGGREISVAAHPAQDEFAGWSPAGDMLLFVSNRTGSNALFGIGVADGTVQGAPSMIKADLGAATIFGLSPAGALYYSLRSEVSSDIQVAPFDFNTGRWASDSVVVSGVGRHVMPVWSPDGRHLAYLTSRSDAANGVLAIRSTETGRVRELDVRAASPARSPRWSPDGRSLMIAGGGNGGGIYRVDVESGAMSPIVPKADGRQMSMASGSPDGKTVFYYSVFGATNAFTLTRREIASGRERELIRVADSQNTSLVVLSPDGTQLYYRRAFPGTSKDVISSLPGSPEMAFIERDVLSGAERELIRRPSLGHPILSPDGRYIATGSTDRSSGDRTVLLIPVAGGEPRDLMRINQPDGVNVGTWAQDSRSLFAVKNRETETPEMLWIPIDSRAIQTVPLRGTAPFSLRVHPDGRQVASVSAVTARRVAEIWVLENFLPPASLKKP